jgi:hypothetical protein
MTHTKDEALKLALEALEESETNNDTMEFWDRKTKAITTIKQALAAPTMQEPVGRVCFEGDEVVWTDEPPESGTLLYTTPPAQPAPVQESVAHSYASTQATMCACCGEHKHTPLRIDKMGGYVCLTCIDKKLGSLLGEFGHPPARPAVQEPVALGQEREAFEAWHDSFFVNKGHAAHHRFHDRDGYCIDDIQNQWKGWKERAKRTTPPAPEKGQL